MQSLVTSVIAYYDGVSIDLICYVPSMNKRLSLSFLRHICNLEIFSHFC